MTKVVKNIDIRVWLADGESQGFLDVSKWRLENDNTLFIYVNQENAHEINIFNSDHWKNVSIMQEVEGED